VSSVPQAASAPPPKAIDRDAALDAEDILYRDAHEAHFTEKDPARALAAWDAYLARYPNGRFVPEAKYNRALSLVRLGRKDEAKEALRPFADGKVGGGYRQRDAEKLLDALE
jgi:TolA-binding protein